MRRLQTKTRQSEPALDQKQVVGAAMQLLDEVGFDGLTMRALADKLGIKAASLYWHVRDKQELLGLLADELCAGIEAPDPDLPWKERLEQLGEAYRRALLAHRDAARVLASSSGSIGPNRLRLSEIVLATLVEGGFGPKDAAYAGLLLNDYVTMFVLEETLNAGIEGGVNEADPNAGNWLQSLPRDEYPNLTALADYLGQPDMEERFRFGIEILQAGLETRLSRSGAKL